MSDLIFFDVQGDSTLKNLNTVIENDKPINTSTTYNDYEQDYIEINDTPNKNKKKNKKKKKMNKNKFYSNPTKERPIIVDDDVYIDIDSDKNENSAIISSNAFDILNTVQINDDMDDEVIKDYLENCKEDKKDSDSDYNSDSIHINKNDNDDEQVIDILNSAFAKNIIKSDVGVGNENIEMEMDLIKILENKLPSDSSSSSSDEFDSDIEILNPNNNVSIINNNSNNNINSNSSISNKNNKNKNNKKRKGKKNNRQKTKNMMKNDIIEICSSNNVNNCIPEINLEDAILDLDEDFNVSNYKNTSDSKTNNILYIEEEDAILKEESNNKNNKNKNKNKGKSELVEIDKNKEIDIISLLEEHSEDIVLISDEENNNIITESSDEDVILISEEENDNDESNNEYDESDEDGESDESNELENDLEDEFDDEDVNDLKELNGNIFKRKDGEHNILLKDNNFDYLLDSNFEGGESTWDLDDKALEEKLKNSKFKSILNSDRDSLLRLQKKKLQKKELAQKKEYLLQKKENLAKENKRIQKVLKSKKGNKLQTSPEVFKYLKHVNITIKEFVTNGFESIPLGNLPSELRKSVGMIAIEYGVKIKTRGAGKRKVTNLIRTSRSRIPDNWNRIVETVFSKTEAQRHSNMDVRKRNLDMAKRRGKYHNNNNAKGKGSTTKPQLGSKVGENANPISDNNRGFKLLQNMGWTPGESLGTSNSSGLLNPIEVVVRDQSGLGAACFDQGYNQNSSSSSFSRSIDPYSYDDEDEYEKDILYNYRSNDKRKNKKKNKGNVRKYNDDNFGLSRKSSKSSSSSKRDNRIGETGGLENSPYSFVNFQKGSTLFTTNE